MSTKKQEITQKIIQYSKPFARRRARQLALQSLYQWQMSKASITEIEIQFRSNNDFKKVDDQYFHILLIGVARAAKQLDAAILPLLDRPLSQLDPVEISALRIGCYEMINHQDVPYRIVINEAIELVKRFGAQDSYRYINSILDKLALQVRQKEVHNHRK